MLIRTLFVHGALALALAGTTGCPNDEGLTPREACEGASIAQCERIYTCFSATELAAIGLPDSESACVSALDRAEGCDSKTVDNACVGNEQFQASKAATCLEQLSNLDCGQIRDDVDIAKAAPACTQVCAIP